jgi:hypothetical protein
MPIAEDGPVLRVFAGSGSLQQTPQSGPLDGRSPFLLSRQSFSGTETGRRDRHQVKKFAESHPDPAMPEPLAALFRWLQSIFQGSLHSSTWTTECFRQAMNWNIHTKSIEGEFMDIKYLAGSEL